ncbi:helix-turn-helix domain-containing protein [Ursidibacter sp. B-7004-1]
MTIFSTDEVLKRLRKLADVETNKELAKLININEKTLAGWKSRNSLPIEALMAFSAQYNVSTDFLLTGKENKPSLDEMEQLLLDNYKRLDSSQKLQLLNASLNGVGSGVNQVANGNNNNQQVFNQASADIEIDAVARR